MFPSVARTFNNEVNIALIAIVSLALLGEDVQGQISSNASEQLCSAGKYAIKSLVVIFILCKRMKRYGKSTCIGFFILCSGQRR